MAQLFLSYAREDAGKAGVLARALERAGHRVWWDRHLGGGSRFAAEIAAALRNAETVIVMWSQQSIDSSWVQDEAAEGRDTGRLIPIILDGTRPPLGFRQFQAIDLSRWSGRGRVPNLAAIENAIATVIAGGSLAAPAEPSIRRRSILGTWRVRAAAAVAAVVLSAGVWLAGSGQLSAAPPTTLAVMPFADFSPARDKAYFAEGVAEEVRTLLSGVPGVQVTGRTSTEMLGASADFRQAREKLGATHLLEGSLRVDGQKLRLNVRLIRTKDGIQVWAERFDRNLDDIFAVQDEVGATVARRLRGALWGNPLDKRSIRTSAEVLDLVLAAEAKWEEGTHKAALEGEKLLQLAVRRDPEYAPAWTQLSRAVFVIDQSKPEGAWGPKWVKEEQRALRYARQAVSVDPSHGDSHAWLGFLEGNKENSELALARIEKAIELSPDDYRTWGLASLIYEQTCERKKELEYVRRITAMEPMQPALDLWTLLSAQGHNKEAEDVKRKLLKDHPDLKQRVANIEARQRGDLSESISSGLKRARDAQGRLVPAHQLNALGATDAAVRLLPSDYKAALGSYWKGDYRTAAAQSGYLHYGYWHQVRVWATTRAMVRTGRTRELLQIFDKRYGSPEEFDRRLRCRHIGLSPPLVMALRAEGRTDEANRLIELGLKRYRYAQSQREYEMEQVVGQIDLLMLAGRHGDALTALEAAVRRPGAYREGPPVVRLELDNPIFNPTRNHPRFKAVEARVAAWRAKELRELAATGVRI